jgi:hypothetical protein
VVSLQTGLIHQSPCIVTLCLTTTTIMSYQTIPRKTCTPHKLHVICNNNMSIHTISSGLQTATSLRIIMFSMEVTGTPNSFITSTLTNKT